MRRRVYRTLDTVQSGGLDQLDNTEKVVLWQRFETFRNRLPLVDHHLIADAEATDLAETYCSATLIRFLVQVLQLSPGEAATRVRAAAAVGPRRSMLGNSWNRCCRGWPRCNVQVWCQ